MTTRLRAAFFGAALFVVLVDTFANVRLLGTLGRQTVTDLAQLLGAAAAAAGLWWTGSRRTDRERRWRWLLGAGMTSWAVGQAIWTYYQLFASDAAPSPSLADVGFLGLPLFALPALVLFPSVPAPRAAADPGSTAPPDDTRPEGSRSLITVLDALIITLSLLVLAWTTALGAAIHGSTASVLTLTVNTSYPVIDVLMVVLVLLLISTRRTGQDAVLIVLGLGLAAIAASDSILISVVATGVERFAPVSDMGFVAGTVLVALSAIVPAGRNVPGAAVPRTVTWVPLLLPYLPLTLLGIFGIGQQIVGTGIDSWEVVGWVVLISLVVVRQLVTLLENHQLLQRVRDGQGLLRYQAFHDPLTGLANRALFSDRLVHAAELSRRELRPLALLFLDLDDFKRVNDILGHAAGDHLLRTVAERLRGCVRAADTVARLGGDEFAVLLESELELPEVVGDRILEALSRDIVLAGSPYRIRASVGLVVADRADALLDADTLLRRADVAMYVAKHAGSGDLVAYRPGMTAPWRGQPLEPGSPADPRRGPSAEEIAVVYQPIVRLTDGRMVALEALARWEDAEYGVVSPDVFIPAAERAGLVAAVDDAVLDRACIDIRQLRNDVDSDLCVHVNVSATRLGDGRVADTVAAALRRNSLPGTALVLEITETAGIPDIPAAVAVLERARALGVRVALDDIGAGHSSIAALLELPVDVVKLDHALTRPDLGGTKVERARARRAAVVRASVTRLAHALGATVVAEGIETTAQAAALRAEGCDLGQGHLYARPAPIGALLLTARTPLPAID